MSPDVAATIERVLRPSCFFVAAPARLRLARVPDERLAWEVFRGHLLDPAHTRCSIRVDTWNLSIDDGSGGAAPLVAVHWQRDADRVHVTRQILSYGFEAYEDSPGVILSRSVEKWVRELVGTIDLGRFAQHDSELEVELATYVFLAVIGTSRLPITSLESPLPAFSLGQLAYLPALPGADAWTDPLAFVAAALEHAVDPSRQAKALETALRAIDARDVPLLVGVFDAWLDSDAARREQVGPLFRELFNDAALSPYTSFVDRLIDLLLALAASPRVGQAAIIDTVSYMLRHLCRHLTAFDLKTFHNAGANFPDALLLDSLLKAYLRLIEAHPAEFIDAPGADAANDSPQTVLIRRRRRAFRQAYLVRRHYEGHRVPDSPTSMGEHLRVLPASLGRVPEEQLARPGARRRRLYEADPLESAFGTASRQVFEQSMADLDHPPELRELGAATFLARPFGLLHEAGEIDRTPLVAYEALSRWIARRRLAELQAQGAIGAERHAQLVEQLDRLEIAGLPAGAITWAERPGVVSLADMHKAAPDFVLHRSTRRSLDDILSRYDLAPLARVAPQVAQWLVSPAPRLLVPVEATERQAALLRMYDERGQARLEMTFAVHGTPAAGYRERGGIEWVERFRVVRVLERAGCRFVERDLGGDSAWLKLK